MKKIAKTVITLGLGAVLAVGAMSAGNLINIEVDPSIKILVNGEEFKPKDVNGKDVMVFSYNGTTYAPLRALAEAYGLEVGYDADKRMATVGEYSKEYKEEQTTTSQTDISSATMGEQNALRSAESYLNIMAFSYSGLIEQLEYGGYTTEEATYAADNCGADWYEQAALSAKSYLGIMAFSKSGLIEQLEYAGFTEEQAIYGAEQNGY